MENEINEINLPGWFDGEVYSEGGTVTNPYSGESCYLNAKELSMYDFIKGAEMLLNKQVNSDGIQVDSKLGDLFYAAIWWFKDNSPKNYMILLD